MYSVVCKYTMKAAIGLIAAAGLRPAAGHRHLGHVHVNSQETDDRAFRIFASTWNAGNTESEKYDENTKRALMDNLLQGHGEAGQEADLVIVGLQEFRDQGGHLNTLMPETVLWDSLSKEKLQGMNKDLNKLVQAPQDISRAKQALHRQLGEFQQHASNVYDDFVKQFGIDGSVPYPDPKATAASSTAVSLWAKQAVKETEKLEAASKAERFKVLEENWKQVDEAKAKLLAFDKSFDLRSQMKENLQPISVWTRGILQDVYGVKDAANPTLTTGGEKMWKNFLASIDNLEDVGSMLSSHLFLSKYQDVVRSQTDALKTWLREEADMTDQKLAAHWDTTRTMLNQLGQKDYGDQESELIGIGGKKFRDEVVPEDARRHLKDWKDKTEKTFTQMLSPTPIALTKQGLRIQRYTAKYQSGLACQGMKHYDTMLFAYTSPWSSWKISYVPYWSKKCQQDNSQGCYINYNSGMECGKVVNLMVFHAQRETTAMRICALNTHMSFAKEANSRLQYISEALLESKAAGCNSTVFVGDFNSRLHCEATPAQSTPLFDGTVDDVLDEFCKKENPSHCPLDNSDQDEFHQFMTKQTVKCFQESSELEAKKKKKSGAAGAVKKKERFWKATQIRNPLDLDTIREASEVKFNPSYKLTAPSNKDFKELEGWSRCLEGESMCYFNSEMKFKRNPAWTDRILIQESPGVKLSAEDYTRRLNPNIDSDHGVVSARIFVTPQ